MDLFSTSTSSIVIKEKKLLREGVFSAPVIFVCSILCSTIFVTVVTGDELTLKTGETVQGRVLSEDNDGIEFEVSNRNRTITVKREIAKSDIKTIKRESLEDRARKVSFEALDQYQLRVDEEHTTNYYHEGIASFNLFLSAYPHSHESTQIRQRREEWNNELNQVARGKVKLDGVWMSPEEKEKRQELLGPLSTVHQLQLHLANLQEQQLRLSNAISVDANRLAQTKLKAASLQQQVDNLTKDAQQLVWNGTRWLPSKEGPSDSLIERNNKLQQQVIFYQEQVRKGKGDLELLERKIVQGREQLLQAQEVYQTAKEKIESQIAGLAISSVNESKTPNLVSENTRGTNEVAKNITSQFGDKLLHKETENNSNSRLIGWILGVNLLFLLLFFGRRLILRRS